MTMSQVNPPPTGLVKNAFVVNYGYRATGSSEDISVDDFLRKLDAAGAGADIAFIVYQSEIKKLNDQVTNALGEVRQTSKLRDAFSKKLKAMRNLMSLMTNARPEQQGDNVKVSYRQIFDEMAQQMGEKTKNGADVKLPVNPANLDAQQQRVADRLQAEFGSLLEKPTMGQDGTVGAKKIDGPVVLDRTKENQGTSVDDIQRMLDNTKDDVRKLDSNREIGMIMLNTWMNKKSNAVNQLTNLIKSTHDTKKSIINKIGV